MKKTPRLTNTRISNDNQHNADNYNSLCLPDKCLSNLTCQFREICWYQGQGYFLTLKTSATEDIMQPFSQTESPANHFLSVKLVDWYFKALQCF